MGTGHHRPLRMVEEADTEPPERSLELPTPDDSVADAQLREALRARLFGGDPEPTKIGRFALLQKLGSGGMGVVYSAYDEELDRKIAIKLLRPDLRGGGSKGRDRLKREAQAMAKLSHPNVATVHEVGEHDGKVFVAMEFVRGDNLRAWLGKEKRSWQEVVGVFAQAGAGLAAAHEAGFVHRDFKPENVVVDDKGRARVLDFGLARPTGAQVTEDDEAVAELDDPGLTVTGTVMGTPAYMSPEQHRGEKADARADQFSFCVALWEALYGERPYAGENAKEIAASIESGRIRTPTQDPGVHAAVRRALEKGLSVDAKDRHESFASLLPVLEGAATPKKSRAWMLGLGVVLATLTGIAGYSAAQPEPVCRPASEWIDPVWGEQRKQSVRAAILAVDAPEADRAWNTLEERLDAYVAEWTDAYAMGCDALQEKDEETLFDRQRLDCLEQRIQELDGIPTIYEDADANLVTQVLPALSSIRTIAGCLSEEGLSLQIAPPEDPQTAKAVQRLRIDLMRARAMATVGRLDEARELNEELATRSESLGYPAVEAEAYLDLGMVMGLRRAAGSGDQDTFLEASEETKQEQRNFFRHAIRAAQATHHDEVLAIATLQSIDAASRPTHADLERRSGTSRGPRRPTWSHA